MIHTGVLLRKEVTELRAGNKLLTERKKRSRKVLQKQGALTKAAGAELATQIEVDEQIGEEECEGRKRRRVDAPHQQRCRRCGKPGHNSRTCTEIEE
jgi:hypothetical protein